MPEPPPRGRWRPRTRWSPSWSWAYQHEHLSLAVIAQRYYHDPAGKAPSVATLPGSNVGVT
ncbi:MAG: hypothetical protein ACXWZL_01400 [Mycobacterium sp.]